MLDLQNFDLRTYFCSGQITAMRHLLVAGDLLDSLLCLEFQWRVEITIVKAFSKCCPSIML